MKRILIVGIVLIFFVVGCAISKKSRTVAYLDKSSIPGFDTSEIWYKKKDILMGLLTSAPSKAVIEDLKKIKDNDSHPLLKRLAYQILTFHGNFETDGNCDLTLNELFYGSSHYRTPLCYGSKLKGGLWSDNFENPNYMQCTTTLHSQTIRKNGARGLSLTNATEVCELSKRSYRKLTYRSCALNTHLDFNAIGSNTSCRETCEPEAKKKYLHYKREVPFNHLLEECVRKCYAKHTVTFLDRTCK